MLPARTTVFLGFSTGGRELFTQLEVPSEGRRLVVDRDNTRERFAVHDRFAGASVVQVSSDPDLFAAIQTIQAIDHHSHALPARPEASRPPRGGERDTGRMNS